MNQNYQKMKNKKKSSLSGEHDQDDDMMDEEVGSDTFEEENEETEDSTEEEEETDNEETDDDETTEDDDDDTEGEEMHLEDDDDETSSRRTVSTASRKRTRRSRQIIEADETDASSIVVALGDDVDVSLHVESLLCRQTYPMSRWLSIFGRMNTRYVINGSRLERDRGQNLTPEQLQENVQLYFVKWKNLSYLHCSWESEIALMNLEGTRMKQKIGKFLRNEANMMFDLSAYGSDVYFNPDFTEVDRVLDVRIVPKNPGAPFEVENNPDIEALLPSNEYGQHGEFVKEFRVKWKSLPYSDITWEVFEDFQDAEVIDKYYEHLNRDISRQVHFPTWRPSISEYRKIDGEKEYKGENRLRSYQVEGANWMIWNWVNGRNSILADEMGLGKTVQSTMFMNTLLKDYRMRYPFLVVAPLSTIPHWEAEIRRWTDLHVVVLHGSVESRENILKYEWKSKFGEFDILITTYEIALVEAALLTSISWTGVVVDEAHRLKGKTNKLGDVLRKIDFGCKLLLTGTPLQNNTEELWTLLNFMQPDKFNDSEQFQSEFGDMKDAAQLDKLHELLKPFMLRRMKEDVEKSLKPKEETVINVELTALQKKYYRAVYDRNTDVFIGADSKSLPSLMNIMMELRKCCNHPFLIRGAEESIVAEIHEKTPELKGDELSINTLLTSSGKMVLLDKLLPKLKSQGHKVLLFSQMVRMLDIIQDYLSMKGYAFERIDGTVKVVDRQAAIERFSTPGSDRFIFLICTRAGGFGINLTAADTVIIYDSDWNPQNDIQAQARCHRIGQDKAVKVYRLITNRTYEMEMFQRANLKLGLDKAVLNPLKQSISADGRVNEIPKMSKKDAETLLKYGAYDFFKEEREGRSEELSNAFCEADIDQILEKNTKVITIDSQGGSSFSKASFITDTSAEVDINDPDFWTKVVGLKPSEEFLEARQHRRTSYSPEDRDFGSEGVAMVDEGEWNKSDRDALLKLLLSFGWGNWEPIFESEKMKKHPHSSVQIMAVSIIGQIARAQKIVDENDTSSKKNGGVGSSSKIAQQAKDALELMQERYEICRVIVESIKRADAGDTEAIGFPSVCPALVRDVIWWKKEINAADRHLKQLSFMVNLHHVANLYHISLGNSCPLPVPRRSVLPTSWWTSKHDYDSILGVIRNGWGNWKDICMDSELIFSKEGVVFKAGNQPEGNGENQGENVDGTPEPTDDQQSSPVPLQEGDTKVFPPTNVIMKRIRRLVAVMDKMPSQGGQGSMFDFVSASPRKTRQVKGDVEVTDGWSQVELKNLRSAILRWGLPPPPRILKQEKLRHPVKKVEKKEEEEKKEEKKEEEKKEEKKENPRENRDIFSMECLPMTPEQQEVEERFAAAATVLSSVIQQVVLQESKYRDGKEVKEEMDVEDNNKEVNRMLQAAVYSHAWHDLYPCSPYSVLNEYGLYSNRLGPFEFLRVQAKLGSKSIDRVQEMCRRIEKRSIERVKQAKENHQDQEHGKKEKEKEKEDVNDIVPTNTIAQRIYRRLELYYGLQQYIWDKDDKTFEAILSKCQDDGPRRNDRLPNGWLPLVHDKALLNGIHKWGFAEWDVFWSNPEMPFFKPLPEKKKDAENPETVVPETQPADEAIMNAKLMDRSLIISGLQSAAVIRHLQMLIDSFRGYDAYEEHFHFMGPEEDPESVPKGDVLVDKTLRHIVVTMNDEKRVLPQQLEVRRTLHWQMRCIITSSPFTSYRSEATRGDPSRAQVSTNALQYYERWLDVEKDFSASGMSIKKIPYDIKLEIRKRAADLLANVNLPMHIRSVTILDFGVIPTNWSAYQSDKYIWPVGFKSVKKYFSYVEPDSHVEYINEILDGGVKGPIFSVTARDDQDHPIQASTPTGCWSTILGRVRKERAKLGLGKTGTAVSGPEFFGFAMPEVAACIEGLEGSELCRDYVNRCLRMEVNRNGKSRLKNRKHKTSSYFDIEEEEPESRLAPRKAAQLASKRWKRLDESESSADFSEEEDEEASIDEMDSPSERRRSRKRSAPSSVTSEPTVKTEVVSPYMNNGFLEKEIKTEQFL